MSLPSSTDYTKDVVDLLLNLARHVTGSVFYTPTSSRSCTRLSPREVLRHGRHHRELQSDRSYSMMSRDPAGCQLDDYQPAKRCKPYARNISSGVFIDALCQVLGSSWPCLISDYLIPRSIFRSTAYDDADSNVDAGDNWVCMWEVMLCFKNACNNNDTVYVVVHHHTLRPCRSEGTALPTMDA